MTSGVSFIKIVRHGYVGLPLGIEFGKRDSELDLDIAAGRFEAIHGEHYSSHENDSDVRL